MIMPLPKVTMAFPWVTMAFPWLIYVIAMDDHGLPQATSAFPWGTHGMRSTIEVHRVFSEVPQFGSLRPLQETDLEKSKTAT